MTIHYRAKLDPVPTDIGGTLAPEYILRLKAEVDGLRQQWAELPALIDKKQKLYEAALLFAPSGFDPDAAPAEVVAPEAATGTSDDVQDKPQSVVDDAEEFTLSPTAEKHSSKVSWVSALRETLTISGRGMAHQELLAFIRANYSSLPVSTGDKGFYNAVSRLADRKEIEKHGGLLYAASVIKEMNARGEELPEAPGHQVRRGSSGDIVLGVLGTAPNGLTGPELRKAVAGMSNAPKSLREHGQYIYNILATLIGAGSVIKEGGVYKLAKGDES